MKNKLPGSGLHIGSRTMRACVWAGQEEQRSAEGLWPTLLHRGVEEGSGLLSKLLLCLSTTVGCRSSRRRLHSTYLVPSFSSFCKRWHNIWPLPLMALWATVYNLQKTTQHFLRLGSHNGISAWIGRGICFPIGIFRHGFQIHGTELEEWAYQFLMRIPSQKLIWQPRRGLPPLKWSARYDLTSDITSLTLLHYREVHTSAPTKRFFPNQVPICYVALLLKIPLATNRTFKEEHDNPLHALKKQRAAL